MRILSFIFACALVLVGSTLLDSADSRLPGIGTFHYRGSPTTTSASLSAAVR